MEKMTDGGENLNSGRYTEQEGPKLGVRIKNSCSELHVQKEKERLTQEEEFH